MHIHFLMETYQPRDTYQTESASTAISAFFKYPANSINAMKYHVSKLHLYTPQKKLKHILLIYKKIVQSKTCVYLDCSCTSSDFPTYLTNC